MDPPAYLTIHITFSLLPPLSTLHAQLQIYTIRFRVYTISQTFFTILQNLKSYISVPIRFHLSSNPKLSATDALALTVEAGLLLDQMIDLSAEGKSDPIPDDWIDEFEKLEFMIARITKEDGEPETPCPGLRMGESPESMRTLSTRFSGLDSVFSTPRREDSMSSVEEELEGLLRSKGKHELQDEVEGKFDLAEEMTRINLTNKDPKVKHQEAEMDEGLLDPALKDVMPIHLDEEGVKIKQEDEEDLPEPLIDADRLPDNTEFQSATIGKQGKESTIEDTESPSADGNQEIDGVEITHADAIMDKIHDEEFDLEEELLRDDNRIFEEYHAISTPPRESNGEIDHSPFLARVIAELEDLEPLESLSLLPDEGSDDDLERVTDLHTFQPHERDIDSDDEFDVDETSMKVQIRTSSPLFDNHELHYDHLGSEDEDEDEDEDDYDDTTTLERTVILDTLPSSSPPNITPPASSPPAHLSLDPFSPAKHTTYSSDSDVDETIVLPTTQRKRPILSRTPSPPAIIDPSTPPSLRDSQLHSKVTQIAHSHPTIALIPQHTTFRPSNSSEYGYYTLKPRGQRSHSRASSHSSVAEEARKIDVQGQNLYVRVLSDRVMVRVGGGWVDLEQYLREYIGKREYRRRSGSIASSVGEYEFVDLDGEQGRRSVTPGVGGSGGRASSSLGAYSSPPRSGTGGRVSSLDLRRSVSPIGLDEKASVGPRRMYVRRKQT